MGFFSGFFLFFGFFFNIVILKKIVKNENLLQSLENIIRVIQLPLILQQSYRARKEVGLGKHKYGRINKAEIEQSVMTSLQCFTLPGGISELPGQKLKLSCYCFQREVQPQRKMQDSGLQKEMMKGPRKTVQPPGPLVPCQMALFR